MKSTRPRQRQRLFTNRSLTGSSNSYALRSAKNGQNIAGGDDQVILTLIVHLGAAILGVQHLVADLDVDRNALAGVVTTARADSQDFTLLRLLLGVVRNEQDAVWVSASACLTMILSSNGVSEIDTVDLLFLREIVTYRAGTRLQEADDHLRRRPSALRHILARLLALCQLEC